jgi:hypothetical protein
MSNDGRNQLTTKLMRLDSQLCSAQHVLARPLLAHAVEVSTMKCLVRPLLAAAVVLVSANVSQANSIINGSFENPACSVPGSCSNGSWGLFESILGWTSPQNVIEIGLGSVYGVTGYDGNQVLELDATGNAVVAQVVAGPGAYTLSFLYADRNHSLTETFEVYWNNTLLASFAPAANPPNSAMVLFSTVVNGAGSNTLEFKGTGASDSYGAIIDDVRLVAVPEGGLTAMLLAVGLLWVAGIRRVL